MGQAAQEHMPLFQVVDVEVRPVFLAREPKEGPAGGTVGQGAGHAVEAEGLAPAAVHVLDREEDGTLEIGPREGFGGPQPTIILSRRDEPQPGKSRLHIDVNATDRDQDAELERLLRGRFLPKFHPVIYV
jgi:hypothetical protein